MLLYARISYFIEAISGLTDYFNKSMLVDMNVTDSWLVEAIMVKKFKIGRIPLCILVSMMVLMLNCIKS